MSESFLRSAQPSDLVALEALLQQSYPVLLRPDYDDDIMARIVPLMARPRPELLASGRYFVIEGEAGTLWAAGGYSLEAPGPRGGAPGAAEPGLGHIRHVATHPAALRQGLGRRLMEAIFDAARAEGVRRFDCLSTRTAVPFYAAMGFERQEEVDLTLAPGLVFPAIRMGLWL